MLILTRKVGQTIVIGDREITVTYLGLNRDQAVIGVEAPKDISVHREEIYDRILKEMNKCGQKRMSWLGENENE